MDNGVSVRFRHAEAPEGLQDVVRKKAQRLRRKHGAQLDFDVLVDLPHRSHRKGNPPRVRITAHKPGVGRFVVTDGELGVVQEDLTAAVDQAFASLEACMARWKGRTIRV